MWEGEVAGLLQIVCKLCSVTGWGKGHYVYQSISSTYRSAKLGFHISEALPGTIQ